MDVFYHLDRTGEALRPGLVMQLMPLPSEVPIEEWTTLNQWFPNGVTRFGLDIILNRLEVWAPQRELELETTRRARFLHLPSRYVSVFACDSAEDMDIVRGQFFDPGYGGKRGRIWKIEGRGVFRADMNLFRQYSGDMTTAASLYWSQQASEEPLYEYLLEPPVIVIEEVAEAS